MLHHMYRCDLTKKLSDKQNDYGFKCLALNTSRFLISFEVTYRRSITGRPLQSTRAGNIVLKAWL